MKSYKQVFNELKNKNQGALVAFTVIGDPDYETSLGIIKKIIDSGANILELGLPFSDPIADGPTIQAADIRALSKGMNTDKAFDFIKQIREYNGKIPIGLLVYGNLIFQRGIDKFYQDAAKVGINSILGADIPIEEADDYIKASKSNNIDTVFIISPLTPDERIKKIVNNVTGARVSLENSTLEMIKRIRKFTNKPLCVGFGISKPEHVKSIVKAGADGVIIGSAIIDLIAKNINNREKMLNDIGAYVMSMKDATRVL